MKIMLINPPIEDFYVTGIRRQPLGLLYIAAALKKAGYAPSLLNCHSGKKSVMELPDEFSYLKPYIGHPDPELRFPYKNYTHYGMSWQEVERRIKDMPSDLYLISSLFTTYYRETERVIEIIRRQTKEAVIAVGGYHPSLYPDYFLNETSADFVISGEGEAPSVKLARALETGAPVDNIPGIAFRNNCVMLKNPPIPEPDISVIPFPARELLSARDFKAYNKQFISLITSRGCPNNCSFCTGKIIWGNGRRERNAEDVIAEITSITSEYKAGIVNFEDDNLFPSSERAVELLEMLITVKEKEGWNFELTAMNGISIEKIDSSIISLMKRAGFTELNISLVTHSADIQKNKKRPFNSAKFQSVAESARGHGMNVRGYFILGMPGQNAEEIRDTMLFMKSIDIKIFPSVYYNVYSPRDEWMTQRSSAFFNESPELSREDLLRCFNNCFSS